MSQLYLTPTFAVVIFIGVVICGHNFRMLWKHQPEGWQKRAWLFGVPAGIGLMALAFLPMKI
ncbi:MULTISPECIES: hypothetical protein [unclassified Ruegeria]|uniref:hypothetical protein n=1 Tax=unclassified Ruegeria TaxID=2625375 RepID=UPI001488F1E9|nr:MULTISPECIES: hypothetical protein [unclassified Ruegeria]